MTVLKHGSLPPDILLCCGGAAAGFGCSDNSACQMAKAEQTICSERRDGRKSVGKGKKKVKVVDLYSASS